MVELYMLVLISITTTGNLHAQDIGRFEHYGQCLQAEAAMSEAIPVIEFPVVETQVYRCFPIPKREDHVTIPVR